ncbi:MAG: DNA-processing protein DprA [Sumerlaeia bacterium]
MRPDGPGPAELPLTFEDETPTPAPVSSDRLRAWFVLLDAALPRPKLDRLLAEYGAPEAILGATDADLQRVANLRDDALRRLRETQGDRARIRAQEEAFAQSAMRLLEPGDDEFPHSLRQIAQPPPALFVRGQLLPEDRLAIALVGPRAATAYAQQTAKTLARDLSPIFTIVSGCALGIDSAAHQAALDAGGRTLGVAGCGLEQDYPQGNGPLRDRIAAECALVSAYPPLTKPLRHHFPARNHLIAGLSSAVVVVEASEKSGALVTARAALDEGREVFAVPGDVSRANSRGSNQLLRDGALVCTCALDVVQDLELYLTRELADLKRQREAAAPLAPPPADDAPPPGLSPAEARVLSTIRHSEQPYDALVASLTADATLSLGQLATALLTLELKGLVKQAPGKVYRPT